MSAMSEFPEPTLHPVFEIDQPSRYGRYLISNPREIVWHLKLLKDQRNFITLYPSHLNQFFLTSIVSVNEKAGELILDAPGLPELMESALKSSSSTLTTSMDRVKVQIRLGILQQTRYENSPALLARLPETMLRLQRREFFRIDTPRIQPLRCKLVKHHEGKESEVFDFPLLDISGGGLCMSGPVETADHFSLGELFTDCRLEIPDESVISVNLRVREVSRLETANGQIQLRLGCEYVNLPSARQNLIERYITRLERSRKAQADLI